MYYVTCTMYSARCTTYYVRCTMYCVCTMYAVLCTMYEKLCTMCDVLCTMDNVQCTMYDVVCTMCIVLCKMYVVPCTMYTYIDLNPWPPTGSTTIPARLGGAAHTRGRHRGRRVHARRGGPGNGAADIAARTRGRHHGCFGRHHGGELRDANFRQVGLLAWLALVMVVSWQRGHLRPREGKGTLVGCLAVRQVDVSVNVRVGRR